MLNKIFPNVARLMFDFRSIYRSGRARLIVIIFSLALLSLLYQQLDLSITVGSSYAILNGNLFEFYDINYQKYKAYNDYFPIVYYIFSAWNLPLFFLDLTPAEGPNMMAAGLSGINLFWNKLMLLIMFIFSCVNLAKFMSASGDVIADDFYKLLATPIALYAVVIFGQYDVIGLFFISFGLIFYKEKRYFAFSFVFGLAFCVKFFALLPFLPLLLYRVKRISKILVYFLIFLAPAAFQVVLYYESPMFNERIFFHLVGKFLKTDQSPSTSLYYVAALYSLLCAYAYFLAKKFDNELFGLCALLLIPFSIAFSFVLWHPQWLIYVSIIYSMFYILLPRKGVELYVVELFGFLSFVIIVSNTFYNNADQAMLLNGLFGSYLSEPVIIMSDIFKLELLEYARAGIVAYMFFPVLVLFWLKFSKSHLKG